MCDLSGDAERLQIFTVVRIGRGVRNISDRLRRLSDRDVGDHGVGRRVDRRERVSIFKPDIDPAAVARRPHAVRKIADRDGRDEREIIGAEYFDLVQAADGDVGECTLRGMREIDVVGDWAGIDRLDQIERRLCVEHLRLAGVLEREPILGQNGLSCLTFATIL